nr:MAG TPA: hypothetical protein [Caudoviricetes sp.]
MSKFTKMNLPQKRKNPGLKIELCKSLIRLWH